MEDADYDDGDPVRAISPAWGHCKRFPHWERKGPTTPACGEHPQYFLKTFSGMDLSADELKRLQEASPGEVIPIDGPIS